MGVNAYKKEEAELLFESCFFFHKCNFDFDTNKGKFHGLVFVLIVS
jgi:hypothetical protein